MNIDVARVPVREIVSLRELHREEMKCQIVTTPLPNAASHTATCFGSCASIITGVIGA